MSILRIAQIISDLSYIKDARGTPYNPPVKCKLLSLKFQHDNSLPFFKAHVAPASSMILP